MRGYLPAISLLMVAGICASARAEKSPVKESENSRVEVATFNAKENLEVPLAFLERLARDLPHDLAGTKKFRQVFIFGDSKKDHDGPQLELTGTLIEYNPGNRAKRLLVGMGAGAGEAVAHVTLKEKETGKSIFERDVTAKMIKGTYGGSTGNLADLLAKEIARVIKRESF